MAVLIFRLNDVPDEEADDVRTLLADHNIDYYETSSGNWGFSVAGIWIKNNDDKLRARSLIDEYQRHRISTSVKADSFITTILQQPLRVIIYLIIISFILYISIMPFLGMGE